MEKHEFEQFLYDNIPITEKMGFTIVEFSKDKVKVAAKLEPNINHKHTAFGGSINSLMTVCGWVMVFVNIEEMDPEAHIVIRKSNIEYLAPIDCDFIAECEILLEEDRNKFFEMYKKHKKGRITLKVTCHKDTKLLAEYEGQYVAFK